jgi:hypothetical protein
VNTLARKLGTTTEYALELINAESKDKIFISGSGDVVKFRTTDNPLFLQNFGVQRIANRKIINPERSTIKKHTITEEITDELVKLQVSVKFSFVISIYEEERQPVFQIIASGETIREKTEEQVQQYIFRITDSYNTPYEIEWETLRIKSKYTNQTLELIDNRLREITPLEIFAETVNFEEKDENCVRNVLKNKFNISIKKINKLGNEQGVTIRELKTFCENYNINFLAYDIEKNVIGKNTVKKKSHRASLNCIAHNNHLYLLKNKYLKTLKYKEVELVNNATDKLLEFLNNGMEPVKVKTKNTYRENDEPENIILSFQVKKKLYVENPDYKVCHKILKIFGIEESIYPTITIKTVMYLIEKLYNRNVSGSIDSFFPEQDKFVKGGFHYGDLRDNYKNVKTIDKNKCYPYCLSSLPFLIQFDYRQSEIIKHNKLLSPFDITKHHLYIVKPKKSSILIPNTNIYSGDHLLFCMDQGLEIFCLEEITTNSIYNFFNEMIKDIFDKCSSIDEKILKDALNIYIGKFTQKKEIIETSTSRICNEEESYTLDGYKTRIKDSEYFIVENEEIKYNLHTRKPISIQIKDKSRRILYSQMLKLGIKEKDVVHIDTDSISFYDKKNKVKTLYNHDNYLGWKIIEPKLPATNNKDVYNIDDLSFKLNVYNPDQKTYYYNCYAGVGKTYYIINKLIPKIKNDYIVLTPSHSALKEYKKGNYKCDVIQKYEYKNATPEQNNIIIDELFLCSHKAHDIIHKCILSNKNVFVFGDDKQLLPVNESKQFNNIYYYKSFYNKHKKLKTNHRNYKEVIKHQEPDYKKADIIICYRNKPTREKYNNLMLKHLGFKDKFQIGVKLICKSNDLRDKNIFNNFTFTITEEIKKKGELSDFKLDDNSIITYKQLDKLFEPYYACTSYGIQGQSIKSYHYAKEDKSFLKNNNRLSYTIISRIKN